MKVELRKIETVRPYPQNPRINDEAVDAVAASTAGVRLPPADRRRSRRRDHRRPHALQGGREAGAGQGARARRDGPVGGPDQGVSHRRQSDGRACRVGLRAAADRTGGAAGPGVRLGAAGIRSRTRWPRSESGAAGGAM